MPFPIPAVRGGHAPPYLRGIAAAEEEHSTTYSNIVMASGPIAYWPLWESTGTVAEELVGDNKDGTYNSDVSGWGTEEGIGDTNTAPTFGGTDTWVDIVTAELNTVWDGDEFTIIFCCKYSAAVDADGVARRVLRMNVDADNQILMSKASIAGEFAVSREANGLYKAIFWTGLSEINWQQFAITMSAHESRQRGYRNGVINPTIRTILQPWTVDPLVDATTKIGAANETPDLPWIGSICHVAIFGQELSEATMLSLVPPGIS